MSPHVGRCGFLALWGVLLMVPRGAMAGTPDAPHLLACDADEGIAVVRIDGAEQALLRGESVASGDWRLTQVTSDSAMFTSTHEPGTTIRVYLDSLARSSLRMTDKPPPAPPAVALDIQTVRAKSKSEAP